MTKKTEIESCALFSFKGDAVVRLGPGGNFTNRLLPINGYNESKVYFQLLKDEGEPLPFYRFDWEEKHAEIKNMTLKTNYFGFIRREKGLMYDPFIKANFEQSFHPFYRYELHELSVLIRIGIDHNGTYGMDVWKRYMKINQINGLTANNIHEELIKEINKYRLLALF